MICILNLVRSAVFFVTFPGYSIRFSLIVSCTIIGSSLCGRTLTTMHEYVTVHTAVILVRVKKRTVFVRFYTFPSNPSASSLFFQRYLIFNYFSCIKSLRCSISPVYVSTLELNR